MKLKNKIALVTGGAKGIGRAISLRLAREGASVVINFSRSEEAANKTLSDIKDLGGNASVFKADVTDPDQVKQLIDFIIKTYQKLDILVNNAGITKESLIQLIGQQDLKNVMDTNFGGVFNCTKEASKHMIYQKEGKIINVSSIIADQAGRGHSHYAASKGAINSFTRGVAAELGPKGINVNTVAPGLILTDMSQAVYKLAKDKLDKHICLRRAGRPEEVASVVSFLSSSDADYITGETINVNGGITFF
ncbi:MAG: 3-oxoacyl-ACP reductase FabG [Proteobacteria bacterium]|nr:3-oxoacyl-ACP reductase FabG [Pseudomonadota bacterium]